MNLDAPVTLLGLDWSEPDVPRLRITGPGEEAGSRLVPLLGEHTFQVEDERKHCVGWFDLTGPQATHRVCERAQTLERGRQCSRCQYSEGFLAAHQAHSDPAALPENIREYLQQPHWLYLDIFADGTAKVGTAAESRRRSRLAEQGPAAALYVARTDDGIAVRALETAVSERFHLTQQVRSTRKVRGLQNKIDPTALTEELGALSAQVTSYLADITADRSAAQVFSDPEAWVRPACAGTVLEAAPVLAYPDQLTTGSHRIHIHGASGPVALLSTDPTPGAARYCADLSTLVGRRLHPASETAPTVSPTLF
ncbi:DUF2797 domain-containing protein [Nocardiopsis sp. HNM0947]|uniref:DUF2797 domain-containing protein n=1 Tax=Nocardiopsis coralli TaxID=2772213 RepID=A0ABR9P062_9ACTN|nr:DUF2797 domain-containing protein [Nocardiopsis coralli]MBE2997210.1 DUF2797 domain-containing protein [Nocardiopsis coralli]